VVGSSGAAIYGEFISCMKCCVDSEYHSALFLDCCGLLRRVLRDLRHDFGFRVGPWNQSYLFDTLPVTIEREEDMKPGDLVFVSAIYHNTKSMFLLCNASLVLFSD